MLIYSRFVAHIWPVNDKEGENAHPASQLTPLGGVNDLKF